MHRRFHHIFPVLIASMCMMLALSTSAWANELSTATVEIRVSQGDDDAEEDVTNNSMDLSSSDLELVRESNHQIIGIRFQKVMIPHKSTITNAYIQFEIDETDDVPTGLVIWGEDMDNPPTFANTDDNISGRSKTMATVVWNNIEKWTGVTKERRVDIGKAVTSDLVKDRAISWGYGTWCSKSPWKDVSPGIDHLRRPGGHGHRG